MTLPINFDINNDGILNYLDIELAEAQGIEMPDSVRAIAINNSQNIDASNSYNTNSGDPQSLDELYAMISAEEDLIAQYENNIIEADEELPELYDREAVLNEDLKSVQSEYNANAGQLSAMEAELSNNIANALNKTEELTSEHQEAINRSVEEAVFEYSMGEYEDQDLQSVIDFKISTVGIDTTTMDTLIGQSDILGTSIMAKCNQLEDITGDLRGINLQLSSVSDMITGLEASKNHSIKGISISEARINNLEGQIGRFVDEIIANYKVAPGSGDAAKISNPQMQKLQEFLGDNVLEKLDFESAKKVLTSAFGSIVKVKNGKITIPKGHDDQSKAILNELSETLKSLYSADIDSSEIKRTDPIGFKSGNTSFDFVIDRNADGIFNGKEEFLGAKVGFTEMAQYDDNKDGVINGDELKDMTVLKTGANGQQSFMKATEIGLDEIDLESYIEVNEEIEENNILAGNFDLTFEGNDITGYQTLDTDKYINENYGNVFGKNFNHSTKTAKNINPFVIDTVNARTIQTDAESQIREAKDKIESKIDEAKRTSPDYQFFLNTYNNDDSQDTDKKIKKKI